MQTFKGSNHLVKQIETHIYIMIGYHQAVVSI